MGNSKGKIKVKVNTARKKAVKPQFGSHNGGLLTSKIVATVKKKSK